MSTQQNSNLKGTNTCYSYTSADGMYCIAVHMGDASVDPPNTVIKLFVCDDDEIAYVLQSLRMDREIYQVGH